MDGSAAPASLGRSTQPSGAATLLGPTLLGPTWLGLIAGGAVATIFFLLGGSLSGVFAYYVEEAWSRRELWILRGVEALYVVLLIVVVIATKRVLLKLSPLWFRVSSPATGVGSVYYLFDYQNENIRGLLSETLHRSLVEYVNRDAQGQSVKSYYQMAKGPKDIRTPTPRHWAIAVGPPWRRCLRWADLLRRSLWTWRHSCSTIS